MCQIIGDVLERTRLPSKYLELEVTETLMLQDEHVLKAIPILKKMGVTLSIDDFGTGYSSLNYLRRLPVEKLKIDQSFVRKLPKSQDDAIIARAIIDLGHALGNDTIDALSKETGLSRDDLLAGLSQQLPDFIDQLTPHGRPPSAEEAARLV